MVLRTLRTDMGGFKLENIGKKDRLTELEFLFPLRPVTREGLAAVYREAAALLPATLPERMDSLRFEPRRGFMTGFMDLVVRHEQKVLPARLEVQLARPHARPLHARGPGRGHDRQPLLSCSTISTAWP